MKAFFATILMFLSLSASAETMRTIETKTLEGLDDLQKAHKILDFAFPSDGYMGETNGFSCYISIHRHVWMAQKPSNMLDIQVNNNDFDGAHGVAVSLSDSGYSTPTTSKLTIDESTKLMELVMGHHDKEANEDVETTISMGDVHQFRSSVGGPVYLLAFGKPTGQKLRIRRVRKDADGKVLKDEYSICDFLRTEFQNPWWHN